MNNSIVQAFEQAEELSIELEQYYERRIKTLTIQRNNACTVISDLLDQLAGDGIISAPALTRMRNKAKELQI